MTKAFFSRLLQTQNGAVLCFCFVFLNGGKLKQHYRNKKGDDSGLDMILRKTCRQCKLFFCWLVREIGLYFAELRVCLCLTHCRNNLSQMIADSASQN